MLTYKNNFIWNVKKRKEKEKITEMNEKQIYVTQ